MTIIEFFDRAPIVNMISCFTIKPDKIIFIGDGKKSRYTIDDYRFFASRCNFSVKMEYQIINCNSLSDIVDKLTYIIHNEDDCIFDLTGGDDLVLVAMGMVCKHFEGKKKIAMQKFDIEAAKVIDCDSDGIIAFSGKPKLSINDNITLYGGEIKKISNYTTSLSLRDETKVETVWNLGKNNASDWNLKVTHLLEFEKYSSDTAPLSFDVSCQPLKNTITNFDTKIENTLNILTTLKNAGLIKVTVADKNHLKYTYISCLVRECVKTQGNTLELRTLLAAKKLIQKYPNIFTDTACGVSIDWDNDRIDQSEFCDPKNEIDVMMMRGLVPIFISCKNGEVEDDELYKLNTVAMQFGDVYAKKVLVATHIEKNPPSLRAFKRRAESMGITVIDNVKDLSAEQFLNKLYNAVSH